MAVNHLAQARRRSESYSTSHQGVAHLAERRAWDSEAEGAKPSTLTYDYLFSFSW